MEWSQRENGAGGAGKGATCAAALLLGALGMVACPMTKNVLKPLPPFVGIGGPVIIAHRGGALEAPENTLAAVQHGLAAGADWVEIDVTLSSDDVPVVIHDDSVDRTSDTTGAVGDMSAAELRLLRVGRPQLTDAYRERLAAVGVSPPDFGDRFADATIPTLEEVLAIPAARVMIELKRIAPTRVDPLARRVVDVIGRTQSWDRVVVASFDSAILWKVHDVDPSIALVGIVNSVEGVEEMSGLPLVALAARIDLVGEALERRQRGVAVWAWTIYTAKMAQAAADQGAEGVITDVPTAVVAALRPEPKIYIEDGELSVTGGPEGS